MDSMENIKLHNDIPDTFNAKEKKSPLKTRRDVIQ